MNYSIRILAFIIGLLAIASMASATTLYLYADTAPDAQTAAADYGGWKASAYHAAASGSFVNMAGGAHPGTTDFVAREAIVLDGSTIGKRLHWLFWLPGETVAALANRLEVKDVADWNGVPYSGEEADGDEVGWSIPVNWTDYDSDGDGTTDGVVGTFGDAWCSGSSDTDTNAMLDDMLACQTYWKGMVRYRDTTTDPWQTRELRLNLTAPSGTIAATAGGNGSVTPAGTTVVSYGGNQTYVITPNYGYMIDDVLVDGVSLGATSRFSFGYVTTNHSISASFVPIPTYTIAVSAGTGGSVSPSGSVQVFLNGTQTFSITPDLGSTIADVLVDGVSVGAVTSYTFSNVAANHTISARFSAYSGSVPRVDQMIKSWTSDTLPASGAISSLSSFLPAGQTFARMGSPTVEVIDGAKWIRNVKANGDGFDWGLYASTDSIPCNGASIVMAVKPIRDGINTTWVACFNVFTYTLSLGIRNDTGNICARRNNSLFNYPSAVIPDGQITILSMVVQPDGTFKVYANGTQIVSEAAKSTFTQISPAWSTSDSSRHINLGRANGSTWSCFNGDIGDTYFYKVALTDAERMQLETMLTAKFLPPAYRDVTSLADLKAQADGTLVRLTDTLSVIYAPKNAVNVRSTSFFYIGKKQGLGGLRVVDKTSDTLSLGDTVTNLTGYVRKPSGGEMYLALTSDPASGGSAPIRSIGLTSKSLATDPKVMANPVVIWGRVLDYDGSASFALDDGWGTPVAVKLNGIAVPSGFGNGKTVIVTGVPAADRVVQAQTIRVVP